MMPLYTSQPAQKQSFSFSESQGSESLDFASFSEKIKAAFQGLDAPTNRKKDFDLSDITLSNTFTSIDPIDPIAAPDSDTYIDVKPPNSKSTESTLKIDADLRDSQLKQLETEDVETGRVSESITPFAKLPRVRYLAHAFTTARDAFDKVYLSAYRLRFKECCSERDALAAKAERLSSKLTQCEQQLVKQREQIDDLTAKLSESESNRVDKKLPNEQPMQMPPVSKDVLETLSKVPENIENFSVKENIKEKEQQNFIEIDSHETPENVDLKQSNEDDLIGEQMNSTTQDQGQMMLNEETSAAQHLPERETEKENNDLLEDKEQIEIPGFDADVFLPSGIVQPQSQEPEMQAFENKELVTNEEDVSASKQKSVHKGKKRSSKRKNASHEQIPAAENTSGKKSPTDRSECSAAVRPPPAAVAAETPRTPERGLDEPRRKRYKTIRIKINPERDNENNLAKSQLLVVRNG